MPIREALTASAPWLGALLAESTAIQAALLDGEGRLLGVNRGLASLLQEDTRALEGQSVQPFLTSADWALLRRYLAREVVLPGGSILLNFVAGDRVPHTHRCRLVPVGGDHLLVAEAPAAQNRNLQEELLELNNQLTTLSRENVRKGRELALALSELKKAQALLVHQEKMASLGQVAAGIAHEINNPLAFVLSNEQVLKRDFDDLLDFINVLGDALPELALRAPGLHAQLLAKAEAVGLEYLAGAVPRKLDANLEGLERVKKIVLDLRNFSRLDEGEWKFCRLSEGLESTLRFLGPLLHDHEVTLATALAELPELHCCPGPLNQAISNIVVNAIQASQPGQSVLVRTGSAGNHQFLEVTDQGVGIPAENLARIFDPFFTTKPVGSGTGLGLSIVHQVVEAHQGTVEIRSAPGDGTTVRLLLPEGRGPQASGEGAVPANPAD